MRNGGWILLDEINLASPEILQCLSSLLETGDAPLLFVERAYDTVFFIHCTELYFMYVPYII